MSGSNRPNHTSSTLRSASWRRRCEAFLVTSLATFLCAILIWPMGVNGFNSEGRIAISVDSTPQSHQQLQVQLQQVLNQCLRSDSVQNALHRVRESTLISSPVLQTRNGEWVRQRISVGLKQENPSEYHLRILFAGSGSADELELVKHLTRDISVAMNAAKPGNLVAGSLPGGDSGWLSDVVADQYQQCDQAQWLLDQMEDGLVAARSQAYELANPGQEAQDSHSDSPSAFQNVSHTRSVRPDVERLRQTIEGVDVADLRDIIGNMRRNLESIPGPATAGLLTNSTVNATVSTTGTLGQNSATKARQYPVGAVPGVLQVVALGLLALLVGGVVAVNMHPFAERGFEDIDQIENSLGVPVIGKLSARSEEADGSSTLGRAEPPIPWANRLTLMGGTLLFSILILAVGFCLVDPAVREAFGQNPFHGFARIVWIFTGP